MRESLLLTRLVPLSRSDHFPVYWFCSTVSSRNLASSSAEYPGSAPFKYAKLFTASSYLLLRTSQRGDSGTRNERRRVKLGQMNNSPNGMIQQLSFGILLLTLRIREEIRPAKIWSKA